MASATPPDKPPDLELGSQPAGYRSGFVSIVGRPNVGKSTLLNQALRAKVAITSDRPQTTRHAIRGILTLPKAQLVFVDTPGLHKPHSALGKRMNKVVRDTLSEVDVVIFLVDASAGVGVGDTYIANELRDVRAPILVALNKIDITGPQQLEAANRLASEFSEEPPFGISARTGAGVQDLLAAAIARLPEGPLLYPPNALTDQPERQAIAELIREKVLELTREEVPHSIAVVVDEAEPDADPDASEIRATIYVERDSQKGIVIGKGGRMLKEIGTRARRDVELLLERSVFLDLRVKVARDWQSRDASVMRFGYGE